MTAVGGAANLYRGAEYEGAFPLVLGSQFWNNESFQNASLRYEGVLYNEVPMAYDLVRNEVVIRGFQQLAMTLEKAKLNAFVLNGHTFVHLLNDPVKENALPDDLYELLYDGDLQVFAKHSKLITRSFRADGQDTIVHRTAYFLRRENTDYPVKSQGDLLHALGKDKGLFKSFWKEKALNFKKDPELFILQTLSYWSSLKK